MTDLDEATVADLRDVLVAIDEEAPPAVELAEALTDATAVDMAAAQETVYDAIDAGVFLEDGSGAFGGVRLAGEHTETPDSGYIEPRGRQNEDDDPGVRPPRPGRTNGVRPPARRIGTCIFRRGRTATPNRRSSPTRT